jgi:hypothetical protein
MESYKDLAKFLSQKSDVKVCILDNNNIQFCFQNEKFFPIDEIYNAYDIVLLPHWVHNEISHSEHRLQYISRIPKPLLILHEELDYLPLVNFEDQRLKEVFRRSAALYTSARKFFNELEKRIRQNGDIVPDDWILDFYEQGFKTEHYAAP